ncbi:cardiolipin synthetase [Pleomassaria siparia CBS 279.74]|uniref:Cardiolipin synthetase n=1 Tax=Pleomassaria siparia CBS 279.74 TaxID=1314801 RepID=A0A6G1KR01_9PLEO|nr:cardiolipin synthetase [Pleomassaria siparia CBS 279.74]
MAGSILSSATVHFVPASRHGFRAFSPLPRIRQIFRPGSSRASCFWSHIRLTQSPRRHLLQKTWPNSCVNRVGLFTTSAVHRARPEDASKQPRKVPVGIEKKKSQNRIIPPTLQKLTTKLPTLRHENIYTVPNILTFSRLIATPVIGYLIIHNQHLYAFTLFLYAGFSDLLDGWIARKWNLQTVVGSVVDPMADKALMTTLVCCLAVNGSLPLPLAVLILGRDVSLGVAAIYYRYASLPGPKTFMRYWDFSLPSAEVHPTTISKFNTFLQLGLIGTTLCVGLLHDPIAIKSASGDLLMQVQSLLGGPEGVQTMVRSMQAVVATTTVYSGLSYCWTKDAVKILGDNEALKKKQGFRGRMVVGGSFGAFIVVAAFLAWKEWERKLEGEDVEDE